MHVEPGSDVERIVTAIKNSEGVKEACRVTGHADVIVSVEGRDIKQVSDIAIEKICAIRGIAGSQTLLCVESDNLSQPTSSSPALDQIPKVAFA
ncbi:MAG: Lrp/AsnC ligand binding domain-containing protein [Nitrososphaerales archaeon]